MKKVILILIIILLVAVGFVTAGLIIGELQQNAINQYETADLDQGTIYHNVEADGIVTSNQTSIMFWKISGEVEDVLVKPGYQVTAGSVLASIDPATTPSVLLLAQIEKITAEIALDLLLNSQLQQTRALNALDKAEKNLDDALHPETVQAEALQKIADANEEVEIAERNYEIASSVPTQADIDAAYANMLLAENQIIQGEETLEKLKSQYIRIGVNDVGGRRFEFSEAEIKDLQSDITKAIKNIELALAQYRYKYNKSVTRYHEMLKPPNPADVALAESDLTLARAELKDAEKEWERVKDGTSPGDLAVFEAELADAQREWERVKDGPPPDDITLYETRIAAADATLKEMEIHAPFDGTVTSVNTQSNDMVEPGNLAFQIDDLTHLYASLNVTEIDVSKLSVGQPVLLTFESVLGKEYHGEISEIGIIGTKIFGASNFRVKVEILDSDENIRLGMTTSAQIIVEEINNVLVVPNQAISGLNGEIVVYQINMEPASSLIPLFTWETNSDTSGGYKFPLSLHQSVKINILPIPIVLGTQSGKYSEILSGELKAGDKIVFDPPSDILN